MEIELKPGYGDLDIIRELFGAYADMLGIDLSFQNYGEELASLPGKYAPPKGRLYIARCGGEPAGCIALRPLDEVRCEMKRLYVKPEFRGLGLGKLLAQQVVNDAREEKYGKMLLDTLDTLKSAVRLYEAMGFYEVEPYYHNPYPGSLYFCLDL